MVLDVGQSVSDSLANRKLEATYSETSSDLGELLRSVDTSANQDLVGGGELAVLERRVGGQQAIVVSRGLDEDSSRLPSGLDGLANS